MYILCKKSFHSIFFCFFKYNDKLDNAYYCVQFHLNVPVHYLSSFFEFSNIYIFLNKTLYHDDVIRKTEFIHGSKRYLTSEVSNFICPIILYNYVLISN